jgi:hypothetical protein
MVSPSSIAIIADCEHLVCSGFSLGELVHLGNLEFITDYFGGLSLSPRRGNEGTIFVGSTRSGASTLKQVTVGDSTEEFLTMSSGEGRFGHPSPDGVAQRPHSTSLQLHTWKESALATTRFPPRTAVPQPKTNHPFEQHHAQHEGQPTQARARHPTAKPESMSR